MLFSGQGKVFAYLRDASGNSVAGRFLGNVSALNVPLATEVSEKKESTSGQRLLMSRLITAKTTNISMTLDEFTADNIGLALFGQKATIAADVVTGEPLPAALVAGDFVRLEQQQVSSVLINDATPTPLTEDQHYRIESAAHGSIEILDPAAFTQPFTADYSYAGGTNIAMFTQPPPIRWLRFEGLNTAESDSPVLVELYKVQFDPIADLALINDEYGEMVLAGSALFDEGKAADASLGPFGRMILL